VIYDYALWQFTLSLDVHCGHASMLVQLLTQTERERESAREIERESCRCENVRAERNMVDRSRPPSESVQRGQKRALRTERTHRNHSEPSPASIPCLTTPNLVFARPHARALRLISLRAQGCDKVCIGYRERCVGRDRQAQTPSHGL
jgi:hypothetical protein